MQVVFIAHFVKIERVNIQYFREKNPKFTFVYAGHSVPARLPPRDTLVSGVKIERVNIRYFRGKKREIHVRLRRPLRSRSFATS